MSGFIGNFLSKMGGLMQGDISMAAGKTVDGLDLSALARYRIKLGTYTGDSQASHAITGVGFQPSFVLCYEYLASVTAIGSAVFKTSDMSGVYSRTFATSMLSTEIISLDSDGFTLGNGANTNFNAKTYGYIAIGLET